jgi:iron complex outermembrane receptor protein
MSSKLSGLVVFLQLLLGAPIAIAAEAPRGSPPEAPDPSPGPELLLFADVPSVVSSTRTRRSLRDVPNAATVITAEEIRESGATSIDELLQTVPGLDLMRLSVSDTQATIRGLVGPSAGTLLVMVDGRSVYLDHFGATLWQGLNVTLQEIERIEVIRGPSSVLFGANALQGTIHIITKRPRELGAAYLRAGAGPDTTLLSATAARQAGRLGVKGSAQYRVRDAYSNDTSPAPDAADGRHDTGLRTELLSGEIDYELSNGVELRVAGGGVRARGDLMVTDSPIRGGGPTSFAQVNLDSEAWRLQGFYSRVSHEDQSYMLVPGLPPIPDSYPVRSSTFDLDLQRDVHAGDHELLFGVNLRRIATHSPPVIGSDESEMHYAGIAQDALELSDRLTGFVGARLDRHPLSGVHLSPRAALVYELGETERLRASVARSFRTPTQIWSYLNLSQLGGLLNAVGNEDLDPVWITSYDVGIEGRPHPRVGARLDLFFNVIEGFFTSYEVNGAVVPPLTFSFRNDQRQKLWGGETALEFRAFPWLYGFASYSFQSANGAPELYTPRHKAVLGLRGPIGPRLRYALTGVYAAHSEFFDPPPLTLAGLVAKRHPDDVPSRFTVDAYLGAQVLPHFELGLHARNLFHQVRRQHPLGDEIGSELLVTGTLEY